MSEQQTHQSPYLLVDLHRFKTEQCKEEEHHLIFSPYYYNCPYYHSRMDYRRYPFINGNQAQLAYSQIYISDEFDDRHCMNWIEYMYHPKIYKTINCDNQNCQRVYCPKRHNYEINQYLYKNSGNNQSNKPLSTKTFIMKINEKIDDVEKLKNITPSKLSETNICGIIDLYAKERDAIRSLEQKLKKYDEKKKEKEENLKIHIHNLTEPVDSLKRTKSADVEYKEFTKGERLDILEDRHHQFKMFKGKEAKNISYMVLEYISAFLNSEGGTIYLGIDDDSIVRGLDVSQKWIDQLLLAIDNDGKIKLSPPLIPQKYKIKVIPVRNHSKMWLNVIEIKVFPATHGQKKILTLFSRQCYMRMNASNHRLSASDIMEYMRINNNGKAVQTLDSITQSIDSMNPDQLKQLQEKVNKLNTRISQNMRKKEREEKNQSS